MDISKSYTEIVPFCSDKNCVIEICVDIGAPQSALREFKFSEVTGHFCYSNSNSFVSQTSNRFIIWKINNQIIEFIENSLDRNLIGNILRLKFQNTPILEGVSIHECGNEIYILIATVSSVYRIILPHPHKINTNNFVYNNVLKNKSNLPYLPSIFYNINQKNFQNYFRSHILNECYNVATTNNTSFILSSCTWLTNTNHAVFALSNSKSGIFVITMSSLVEGNQITTIELKQNNIMKRLFNGIVPSIIRGVNEGNEVGLSLLEWSNKNDHFLIVLCKDFKIKIWSYKKQECCVVYNLLDVLAKHQIVLENLNTSKDSNLKTNNSSLQKSFLRKSKQNNQDELIFSTFVPNSDSKQFIVLKLNNKNTCLTIDCLANIYSPEIDLIDFIVSQDSLCSLWLNDEGETIVLSTSFKHEFDSIWKPVSLSSSYLTSLNLKSIFLTSKEHYVDEIFYNGKFNLEIYAKTLSIYNRNLDHFMLDNSSLFKDITSCVEFTYRELVASNELSSEEYTQIEGQCWEKFYSYCLQYKSIGNKPIGLFYDNKTDFLGLIKKDEFVYLKVNDCVSDITLNCNSDLNYIIKKSEYDWTLKENLSYVLNILKLISDNLPETALIDFELAFLNRETVEKATDDILENYLLLSTLNEENPLKSFSINNLDEFFKKVPYFESIFEILIKILDLEADEYLFDETLDNISNVLPTNFHNFMSSLEGINLICSSIHQNVRTRFKLCRNFILLQKLLLTSFQKNNLYSSCLKKIRTNFLPQSVYLLHAYYVMVWICEKKITLNEKSFVCNEERNTVLSLLGLNEYINLYCVEKNNINDLNCVKPLIFFFLQLKGLNLSKKILLKYNNINSMSMFKEIILLLEESILKLLWPASSHFVLPEFLFGIGQYDILIDYVNDLDYWCDYNVSSLQFIKALSYLELGYPDKSIKYFNSSFNKINNEPFLIKVLQLKFDTFEDNDKESFCINQETTYLFYQKLIQFFELLSQTDYKIQLCNLALCKLVTFSTNEKNETYRSAFYSILFIAEIELGNYDSAFNIIQINNLIEQKKNCLRQFIVCLFEKNLIEKLISYSYNDLEEDFVTILESKARSSDIAIHFKNKTNSYYEVLYCYFNKNNNFRKAASLMYEYSRRLFQEVPGIESLTKQVLCLGLTLNNLRIIDPEYAWIIKPTIKILSSNKNFEINKSISILSKINNNSICSSKRCHEGNSIIHVESNDSLSNSIEREIEILDIDEIKKEYYLTQARLMLLEKDAKINSIANTYLQVEEIINLLLTNCMFDFAFKLSFQINLPIEKIFEELVNKYVYVANNGFKMDDIFKNIQNWFIENETASLTYISMSKSSLINKMWLLINEYILRYEKAKQTVIHKCVAEKLLMSAIPIPYSLKTSYQKRNSAELLYLYLCYNCIEDAYYLSVELINGFLSIGTEYFDINYNVMSEEISYFPNQHIKKLLSILKEKQDDSKEFLNMYDCLNEKLEEFKNLSLKASERIYEKKNLQIEIENREKFSE